MRFLAGHRFGREVIEAGVVRRRSLVSARFARCLRICARSASRLARRSSASRMRRFSVRCVRLKRRDWGGPSLLVERDHRDVSGVCMAVVTGAGILGLDADTDFHGGSPGRVHGRAERDEFADEDRDEEIHPVHPDGDDPLARVLDRGQRSDLVRQAHDRAAVDVADAVGVGDSHPADELGARRGRSAGFAGVGVRGHGGVAAMLSADSARPVR